MADKDYIEILEKEIYERFLKIKEEYQSDYPEYTHDFDHLEESLRHELNLVSYRIDTHNNVKENIAELIENLDEAGEMSLLNPNILEEIASLCDVNLDFKTDEKPPYQDYIVTISFYANNGKDCSIDFGGPTKEKLLKHIHDFMDKDFQECREEDKAFWANQYDNNNTFYQGVSLDEVLEDVEEEWETYEKIAEYFKEFEKQGKEKELEKEIKHSITGITLLSKEEARQLDSELLRTSKSDTWWLRSPGCRDYGAAFVFGVYGRVDDYGFYVYKEFGVRPALCISNSESLPVGNKFELAGHNWTIISDKYALCDDVIGKCAFQKDYNAKDANDYEHSDVKKFIENWAKEKGIEFNLEHSVKETEDLTEEEQKEQEDIER